MEGEDVKDESCSIDDLDIPIDRLLQIGLLGRSELIVDDDDVDSLRSGQLSHLLLATAHERSWIRRLEPLGDRGNHIRPSGMGKPSELLQG